MNKEIKKINLNVDIDLLEEKYSLVDEQVSVKKNSGFSLIESLVAIFIFSLVAAMLAGSFSGFFKTYVSARKAQKNMESGQYVMNLMTKTIRSSTIDPAFVSEGSQLMMFDNSKSECVIYNYDVDGRLKVATSLGDGIDSCVATSSTSFFPLTNAGEISGVTFAGIPSSEDGTTVGKLLIKINSSSDNASQMQTTVSLRDTKIAEPVCIHSCSTWTSCSGGSQTCTAETLSPLACTGGTSAIGTTQSCVEDDVTAPVTTPSPAGGTTYVVRPQTVTLTANESATIYYTTDGTNPTTSSPVYSSPISISIDTTLKYFAKDTSNNSEAVKTSIYDMDENWIGIAQCSGLVIANRDASVVQRWKTTDTSCVSPDCETGVDNTYPANYSLIWSDFLPSSYSAQNDCLQNYGIDARLPTMAELQCIYDNWSNYTASGSDSFQYEGYWSATEYGTTTGRFIDFSDGISDRILKTTPLNVRCVRQ